MYRQCVETFKSMVEKLDHGDKIIFGTGSHSGPKRHPADQGLDGNGLDTKKLYDDQKISSFLGSLKRKGVDLHLVRVLS